MKTFYEKYVISVQNSLPEALARLVEFYEYNGYTITGDDTRLLAGDADVTAEDEHRDGIAHDPLESSQLSKFFADAEVITLQRGKPRSGWWSCDLSSLHTVMEISARNSIIAVTYKVDVRGQTMTRDERLFWRNEAQHAEQYMTQRAPLVDLRIQEAKRAEEVSADMRRTGMFLGMLVFLLVTVLSFFGIIL